MCSSASVLLPFFYSNSALYSARTLTGRGGGDAEKMFWPFLGSWWPSWSICSMTLPGLFFFSGFRQAGFLYRSLGSAIAHRQSLSNASILGISLEAANVLCKWNGVNTRKRMGVGAKGCGRAEPGAFQVPSWSGSLSFTMRQYFSLRKCHFTFIWGGLGKRATTEYKVRGKCSKNHGCGIYIHPRTQEEIQHEPWVVARDDLTWCFPWFRFPNRAECVSGGLLVVISKF